jgi:hypothetical protein
LRRENSQAAIAPRVRLDKSINSLVANIKQHITHEKYYNKVRYLSTTTKSLYTNSTESTEPANSVQQLGQSSQFLKELASRLTEAGGKITIELEPGKGDKLTIPLEFIEWLRGLVDG